MVLTPALTNTKKELLYQVNKLNFLVNNLVLLKIRKFQLYIKQKKKSDFFFIYLLELNAVT